MILNRCFMFFLSSLLDLTPKIITITSCSTQNPPSQISWMTLTNVPPIFVNGSNFNPRRHRHLPARSAPRPSERIITMFRKTNRGCDGRLASVMGWDSGKESIIWFIRLNTHSIMVTLRPLRRIFLCRNWYSTRLHPCPIRSLLSRAIWTNQDDQAIWWLRR